MSNTFQTWIRITKDLIDQIHKIPSEYPKLLEQYNSNAFSFIYDPITNRSTFKRSVKINNEPTSKYNHHLHNPHAVNSISISGNVSVSSNGVVSATSPTKTASVIQGQGWSISNNTFTFSTDDYRYQVNITLHDDTILNIKFIKKDANGISYISNTGSNDFVDGGKLLVDIMYVSDDLMMVDGIMYDKNEPEAFQHDISTDTGVSLLDLFYLREYYGTSKLSGS